MSQELPSPISFLKLVTQGPPYLSQLLRAIGFEVDQEERVSYKGTTVGQIDGQRFRPDKNGIARLEGEDTPRISRQQYQEYLRLDRARAAVHEAGHVVAAKGFGWKVLSVSLPLDSDSGKVDVNHDDDSTERRQRYLAAGAAAESIFYGTYASWGVKEDRGWVDLREKLESNRQGTNDEQKTFDDYVLQVRFELEKDRIEAVANPLKSKPFLTSDDVESILGDNI